MKRLPCRLETQNPRTHLCLTPRLAMCFLPTSFRATEERMENVLEPGGYSQLVTWTSTNRSPLFTDSLDLWPQETAYKTRPLRAPPTVHILIPTHRFLAPLPASATLPRQQLFPGPGHPPFPGGFLSLSSSMEQPPFEAPWKCPSPEAGSEWRLHGPPACARGSQRPAPRCCCHVIFRCSSSACHTGCFFLGLGLN